MWIMSLYYGVHLLLYSAVVECASVLYESYMSKHALGFYKDKTRTNNGVPLNARFLWADIL